MTDVAFDASGLHQAGRFGPIDKMVAAVLENSAGPQGPTSGHKTILAKLYGAYHYHHDPQVAEKRTAWFASFGIERS